MQLDVYRKFIFDSAQLGSLVGSGHPGTFKNRLLHTLSPFSIWKLLYLKSSLRQTDFELENGGGHIRKHGDPTYPQNGDLVYVSMY